MRFDFVGTTSQSVDLSPDEFAGLSVPQITAEILETLSSIAPHVDFFEADVEAASRIVADSAALEVIQRMPVYRCNEIVIDLGHVDVEFGGESG